VTDTSMPEKLTHFCGVQCKMYSGFMQYTNRRGKANSG